MFEFSRSDVFSRITNMKETPILSEQHITVPLGEYSITIDTHTGGIAGLRRADGPQTITPGGRLPLPLIDVATRPLPQAPRYLSHSSQPGALEIQIRLGDLLVHDHLTLTGDLIERRVVLENTSRQELQITGLRIGLDGVAIGDPADCLFEAPANVVRPRVPLALAASQPISEGCASGKSGHLPPPDPRLAPGAAHTWGRVIGDAPDIGPGLMILHNPRIPYSLLTWYVSASEAASPRVGGDGVRAALMFDVWLAGWLKPGASLSAGTQYILLQPGEYPTALAAYSRTFDHTGITPPVYGSLGRAAGWSGLYEVHPGQFGGFVGLTEALPGIAALGVDTIYLLPVQKHRNKRGLAWDENWEGMGSPYAILDFERLEPSLGTEQEFSEMVEAAHTLNLRVLMDFVPQGCGLEADYVTDHPDWFTRDEQGQMLHSHGWNDTWSFDWANWDFQQFMIDWALNFVRIYHIDGFRIDAPHGKEPNWDRAIPYHASRTSLGAGAMLERLRHALLNEKTSAALYCELFGPLWIKAHDISNDYSPYALALNLFERTLSVYEFGEYLQDYWAVMPRSPEGIASPRICFMETHDTRSGPAYALRGSAIQQALMGILVLSGFVPMIWSGQEKNQREFLRSLISARASSPTLQWGEIMTNRVEISDRHYRRDQGDAPSDHLFAILRQYGDETVLGLASLFPEKVTFSLKLPVADLGLRRDQAYRLVDVISGQAWNEYGRGTWTGAELAAGVEITPEMFRPVALRIEVSG
jgi:glycosidase